jgi:hypothetical protein
MRRHFALVAVVLVAFTLSALTACIVRTRPHRHTQTIFVQKHKKPAKAPKPKKHKKPQKHDHW